VHRPRSLVEKDVTIDPYFLILHAFHNVTITAHRDGSLTVGPGQAVVDGIDVGADENDERVEQSVFLLGIKARAPHTMHSCAGLFT
jgi:hypothetical protein